MEILNDNLKENINLFSLTFDVKKNKLWVSGALIPYPEFICNAFRLCLDEFLCKCNSTRFSKARS